VGVCAGETWQQLHICTVSDAYKPDAVTGLRAIRMLINDNADITRVRAYVATVPALDADSSVQQQRRTLGATSLWKTKPHINYDEK